MVYRHHYDFWSETGHDKEEGYCRLTTPAGSSSNGSAVHAASNNGMYPTPGIVRLINLVWVGALVMQDDSPGRLVTRYAVVRAGCLSFHCWSGCDCPVMANITVNVERHFVCEFCRRRFVRVLNTRNRCAVVACLKMTRST